jgi:hypothetical protein
MTGTMAERIVARAKELYAKDLKHERYSYAVTQASKLLAVKATESDKREAEQLLRNNPNG